jgi:large subunit ribosomal protein L10
VNRAEKAQVIDRFKERADQARICILTDFKGMSVEEMTDLRAKLRDGGVDYQVVKNTLARIALKDSRHEVLAEKFKENNAVAFGYDDPVVAAKTVAEFLKTSKKLKLKEASLMGQLLSEEQLKELAKLPGRPELLGKLLGTMNAVPTNFVSLFGNLLRNLLYALKAIEDQKQESA